MTGSHRAIQSILAAPSRASDRFVPLGVVLGVIAFHFVANSAAGGGIQQRLVEALAFGVLSCSLLLGLPMVGNASPRRQRLALAACTGALVSSLILLGYIAPWLALQGYFGSADGGPEYWKAHEFLVVAATGRGPFGAEVEPGLQLYASVAVWRNTAKSLFVIAAFVPAMAPWRMRVPWWATCLLAAAILVAERWMAAFLVRPLVEVDGGGAPLLLLVTPQATCAGLVVWASRRFGRRVAS